MLEPTLRELLEDSGVQNIIIKEDSRGIKASGEFKGTEQQLRRRLDSEIEIEGAKESADAATRIVCRPKV